MKVVTTEQMRELDCKTIERFEIPGEVLMDRAGTGVAEIAGFLARSAGYSDCSVLLIAGRGNNGGDAFVAARVLKEMGFRVETWLAGEAGAVTGDALTHLSRMKSAGITLYELPTMAEWDDLAGLPLQAGIVVDGILGTGISGPARGPAAGAIRAVNAFGERNLVVSIDIPSGLNSDTGEAEGDAVMADVTVTMGLPKRGLIEPRAVDCVGSVEVVDIGIPAELTGPIESETELVTLYDLGGLLPRRARSSHKGTFGHVLIVGGAPGYAGAAAMAARAATRSGAGLVSVLTPPAVAPTIASIVPEAMVHASAGASASGSLPADIFMQWVRKLPDFDAILVGPGMTTVNDSRRIVESILHASRVPVVVDADGLSVLSGKRGVLKGVPCPVVLTPHPGEMARLRGKGITAADIQADRFGMARITAEETESVVVLKGAGTVIAAPGRPLAVNLTGNPGMATGGMGDVLGGLLAGLLAQKVSPFDAARMAVYLHGRAGDAASWHGSQCGTIADDVIEELPHVFRDLSVR